MRFVDTSRVRTRFDVRVRSSDGTELSVDIYRPTREGRYPVLVTRTASDNNRASWAPPQSTAPQVPSDRFKLIAEHGFIVVAADVRGRGDSDGHFTPFAHEASDGADLVEWVRALPDGNGRVGAFGSGYAGFAALAAAGSGGLDAVAVWSPLGVEDLPARGGAVRLDWLFWQHLIGGRFVQPADVPPWTSILRHRPLTTLHNELGRPDAPWGEWMQHLAPDDPYWAALDLAPRIAAPHAPTLFVTGWWDPALTSTLALWRAASAERSASRDELRIGPWDASAVRRPSTDVGGVAWGPAAGVDHERVLIDWFRRQFASGSRASPVRAFVTGRNEWLGLDSWPDGGPAAPLWLHSGGRANSRIGDGLLLDAAPSSAVSDEFTHDPDNPVPWQPEGVTFSRSTRQRWTLDSSFATSRDDVLVYTAAPARSPQLYVGRPVLHLQATTELDDADWFAWLEDVFPGSGRSMTLAHGVVRARTVPAFAPGRATGYTIPLTEIAHEVQPGHALRLVVASSCFPLYAVNAGADDYTAAVEARRGIHTIHHGQEAGSRLELPLLRSPRSKDTI